MRQTNRRMRLMLAASAVALIVGGVGGWYVVTKVLTLPFDPDPAIVAATLVGAIVVTIGIGVLGNVPTLGTRPGRSLREN